MHQEILETTKKVKCNTTTFCQAGSKILKAKALEALCITGKMKKIQQTGKCKII